MKNYKLIYGFIAILLFVLLKFWYAKVSNEEVLFLLKPTDLFINTITSTKSIFNSEIGFYNAGLNIIINKSCSGFNFFMISFLMLVFVLSKSQRISKFYLLFIPISLLISYFITVFVNVTRILFSINMNRLMGNDFSWMHQMEGTFVYLFFLIIVYFIVNQLLTKFGNEKFA